MRAPSAGLVTDLFVDGEWRAVGEDARFAVTDPTDGSTIAEFAIATPENRLAAVDAVAAAQPGWAATAPRARSKMCVSQTYAKRPNPRGRQGAPGAG